VALTAQPALDVVVTATRTSGDADVTVASGPLTFTRANWSTPQMVIVAAGHDGDGTDDHATVEIAAAGVPAQSLAVTVRDTFVGPPPESPVDAAPPADSGVDRGPVDAGDAQATNDAALDAPIDGARPDPVDRPDALDRDGAVADTRADAAAAASGDDGCGCRVGARPTSAPAFASLLLLGLIALARRRR
jgi:MYXO-CTERM domain-containing protein